LRNLHLSFSSIELLVKSKNLSFSESLLKEYKTKIQDYDQLQAKLKEFEGAEAKLKDYDSLTEQLKVLQEKGERGFFHSFSHGG